jgi:hypothetical protein
MRRITGSYRRSRRASPVDSAFLNATSSAHFQPFVYGGFGLVGVTVLMSKLFGLDRGLMAVIAGAIGVVGFVVYAVRATGAAKQEMAAKRAEFYQEVTPDEEPTPPNGK